MTSDARYTCGSSASCFVYKLYVTSQLSIRLLGQRQCSDMWTNHVARVRLRDNGLFMTERLIANSIDNSAAAHGDY